MSRNSSCTFAAIVGAICWAAALFNPQIVSANPSGGQVVGGQATIGANGPTTTVIRQSSSKVVIDWRSFNIAPNETTQFVQPSASAIALNRVTGNDPSQLLGQLGANGQVWLINPNGIVFGKSSRVDVAGLLATTLDIDNQAFLSGSYKFDHLVKPGTMVVNQGSITIREAGLAALVAPGVENTGTITADLGQIQMSATTGFTVDLYGDGKFNFQLDGQVTQSLARPDGSIPTAAVSNSGTLIADGGRIYLTANAARSVIDNAINMSGVAEANSVSLTNGEIVLDGGPQGTVQVGGQLNATGAARGQTGGKIEVLGDTIHVASGTQINASGSYGGGRILIGGDFQGGSPTAAVQSLVGFTSEATPVRNANAVTVDNGTVIDASAGITGRGGQIAIWSTGITSVAAYIDASGGIVRGAGGIVETSGHALNTLDATINVNGGFGGIAGTWLLDPHFVVTADGDFAGVGPGAAAGDVNTGLLIRPGDLVAIYGVSSLLPDTDDAGTAGTDPDEESEHRYPYAVVPSNGLFAQIGSIGPTPIGSGVTFGLGLTTGNLILGINGEDGGPQGQYDVNVQVVSRGELAEVAIPVILLNAIPYIGELADVAFAGRIARLVKTGQEIDEAALSADAAATEFTTAGAGSLPEDVQTAIEEIKSGANRPNVKNPQPFRNDGSQDATILPRKDASGNPISYTENYVNPKINGVPRDGQRVITGSDGSTWYTPDHYTSWIKVGN